MATRKTTKTTTEVVIEEGLSFERAVRERRKYDVESLQVHQQMFVPVKEDTPTAQNNAYASLAQAAKRVTKKFPDRSYDLFKTSHPKTKVKGAVLIRQK